MTPLLLAVLAASGPVRLAQCNSGKTGHLELFVSPDGKGAYTLSSHDDATPDGARTFTGTVLRATHHKLDKRHHVYVFALRSGQLQQAAGLDDARCPAKAGRGSCRVDSIEVRLARGGPTSPSDDGLSARQSNAAIALDGGGPKHCMVYASRALTALLRAGR